MYQLIQIFVEKDIKKKKQNEWKMKIIWMMMKWIGEKEINKISTEKVIKEKEDKKKKN